MRGVYPEVKRLARELAGVHQDISGRHGTYAAYPWIATTDQRAQALEPLVKTARELGDQMLADAKASELMPERTLRAQEVGGKAVVAAFGALAIYERIATSTMPASKAFRSAVRHNRNAQRAFQAVADAPDAFSVEATLALKTVGHHGAIVKALTAIRGSNGAQLTENARLLQELAARAAVDSAQLGGLVQAQGNARWTP
jgi:hypothetical protein